ncbi:hypothetical protein JW823_01415 [bacterium]|nr:hypothetical protein [candidate division CSSED10-310 bacterium]
MGAIFGIVGAYSDNDIQRMSSAMWNRSAATPIVYRFENAFIGVGTSLSNPEKTTLSTDAGAVVIDGYTDRNHHPADLLTESTDAWLDCAGLFTAAVYEKATETLRIARDVSGARPLYYSVFRNNLIFASSPRAILSLPGYPRRLNPDGIALYLSMICPPDPVTIYDSVFMLRPGFLLTWTKGQIDLSRLRYPVTITDTQKRIETDIASDLRHALETAVIDAIPQDPDNTAFFLSGGTDTGAVVALASKAGIRPINTYTIGYEGSGTGYENYNEFYYAGLIASHYQTRHHEFTISPDTVRRALPGIIAGLDQPSGDAINTYLVAGTLPETIHTVMTGTGGDEVFIGSHWFRQQARLQVMHRRWEKIPSGLRRIMLSVTGCTGGSFGRRLRRLDLLKRGVPAQYRHFKFLFEGSALDHLLMPEYRPNPDREFSAAHIVDLYDEYKRYDDDINRMESLLFQHEVSNLQLRDIDSMCLAHGIEARSPLVDRRVLDLLDSIPGHVKAPDGRLRHLMFLALDDCLLTETRTRRKMSFIVPMDLWARRELRPAVEYLLSPEVVKRRGILNPSAVAAEKEAYFSSGKERHPFKLWNLALLELWCRFHIDAPLGISPPNSLDDLL